MREDLYYRINTIEIKIPPLRERMDDVPMLAEHFLQIYSEKYKKDCDFSETAYDQMLNYNWRGNVRELQHVIERAVLLCKGSKITNLNIPKNLENTVTLATIQTNNYELEVERFAEENLTATNSESAFFQNNLSGDELFEKIGQFIVQKLPEPEDGIEQKDIFSALENVVVSAALERTNGNKQAAANLLGLYRPRLYGMIKRHEIGK